MTITSTRSADLFVSRLKGKTAGGPVDCGAGADGPEADVLPRALRTGDGWRGPPDGGKSGRNETFGEYWG